MAERSHGLETFLEAHRADGASAAAGLGVAVLSRWGHLNLRLDPSREALATAAHRTLGQDLPRAPNTMTRGDHFVFWLGPDEWHVMTRAARAPELTHNLEQALAGGHAAVNDLSGSYVCLRLDGAQAGEVLQRGCTLDLHPRVFAPAACAQSALAGASVLIARTDNGPGFLVMVRRSFALYLALWLERAAREEGTRFALSA